MLALLATLGAPQADLVTSMPGFNGSWPFKVYSGMLTVPGPFALSDYDSLKIHYQFHTSQSSTPLKDPLVTWHQGGPGGSAIAVGLYTEMGYFQLSDQGSYYNEYAWNKKANMLYLESPAGSGQRHGYSECIKGGKAVACHWNDVNQGEAYAHSLAAFHKAFPEYAKSDLYLTGESYFGQYGPNIANYILTHAPFNTTLGLKGIAAGNACWGGTATRVTCNGENSEQNDIDMYFGKGLMAKKLYQAIYAACGYSHDGSRPANVEAVDLKSCEKLQEQAHEEVGPHNVYNIYDNCPRGEAMKTALKESGKSMRWLLKEMRELLTPGSMPSAELAAIQAHAQRLEGEHPRKLTTAVDAKGASSSVGFTGGYDWSCGGMSAASSWLTTDSVKKALHLGEPGASRFGYSSSGPASVTLWPFLARNLRVLIYNGDADSCVPYKGNEEWITGLETAGDLAEKDSWRPWYLGEKSSAPAGYVTTYTVPKAPEKDFSFVTIRLAGHMVPTFQPAASSAFLQRWLAGEPM